MNPFERLFLRAKHWHIFLLLVGVAAAGEIMVMRSFPVTPPPNLDKTFATMGWVTAVSMLCFMAWFWSMGSFLSSIAQSTRGLNIWIFRFALIYPAVYTTAFFLAVAPQSGMPAFIIPFHLFAMVCMFYDLYFVSKALVIAETGRAASFYDFSGPFFLLWFFPIGVWVIQPRINRLFRDWECRRHGRPPSRPAP